MTLLDAKFIGLVLNVTLLKQAISEVAEYSYRNGLLLQNSNAHTSYFR